MSSQTELVRFPARTVVGAALLLLLGLLNLLSSVVMSGTGAPWWELVLSFAQGLGLVVTSLAFLIKRSEGTYNTVSLVFGLAVALQIILFIVNRKVLLGAMSGSDEATGTILLTIVFQVAFYALVFIVGLNKKAQAKFKAWWASHHPETENPTKEPTN